MIAGRTPLFCDLVTILSNMPTAQSAQQLLRQLDKNWTSFFAAIKDWKLNKGKYTGMPRLPKYKRKDGRCQLTVTNQNCTLMENGTIQFPKSFKGFTLMSMCRENPQFVAFQLVRFIPRKKHLVVEVVYQIQPVEEKEDNGRYLSIDLGVDNLAAVTNNIGATPFIINGMGLKSINQYYNKQISHYQEVTKRINNRNYSNRMNRITTKRNRKINDYMHKASRFLINYAKQMQVNTIVIGKNKSWKQNLKLGGKVNQSFTEIPHQQLIEMIKYKAKTSGIQVRIKEEGYTSGTSFLDQEKPIKRNYNKARRIYRGLFISNGGVAINADVNASLQILKKYFRKFFLTE